MNKKTAVLLYVIMLSGLFFGDSAFAMRNQEGRGRIVVEMPTEKRTVDIEGTGFSVNDVIQQFAIEREIRKQQQAKMARGLKPQKLEEMVSPTRNVQPRNANRNRNRAARPARRRPQKSAAARRKVVARKRALARKKTASKKRGRKKPAPKKAAVKRQNLKIDDAFVKKLVQAGIVDAKGFTKLPDGSYVVQIKAISQAGLGGGVCPAMGLRSAQLMLNYLYVFHDFQKDDMSYLRTLNNRKDAQGFLKALKARVGNISNLTQDQIEAILQKRALETLDVYNKTNNILCPANPENLVVVDSVKIETKKSDYAHPQVENLIMAQTTVQSALNSGLDCFYRVFVVGTEKVSGGHWIGAAVTKINGKLYWLVCDSSRSATNVVKLGEILAKRMLS